MGTLVLAAACFCFGIVAGVFLTCWIAAKVAVGGF